MNIYYLNLQNRTQNFRHLRLNYAAHTQIISTICARAKFINSASNKACVRNYTACWLLVGSVQLLKANFHVFCDARFG